MPPVASAVGAGMGEPMRERLRRREKAADRGGNTSREQVMTDNRHGLNVICLMTGVLPALPAQRDRRRIRAFARLTAGQCPLPGRAAAPGGCPMVPGILTKLYIARM